MVGIKDCPNKKQVSTIDILAVKDNHRDGRYVRAEINGVKALLLIDTGATCCVINQEWVEELKLKVIAKNQGIVTANSRSISTGIVVGSIELLGKES